MAMKAAKMAIKPCISSRMMVRNAKETRKKPRGLWEEAGRDVAQCPKK